jgi:hypothetical protein
VGHGRLILERFGRFWGAFSVIDLFLLNALTIVTEFIGIALALDYLGLPRQWGVAAAALIIVASAATGSFRRFERIAMCLVGASLLLVPVVIWVHPPAAQVAHDLVVPGLPYKGALGDVMLLIIAIVGTTVAPWQLFFQQSYVIDKRITPRFLPCKRRSGDGDRAGADWRHSDDGLFRRRLCRALRAAISGTRWVWRSHWAARAAMGGRVCGSAARCQRDRRDGGVAVDRLCGGRCAGCAIRCIAAQARPRAFAVYAGLVALAAGLVLTPGTPLGLLTNAVQTLAGVLLPSATVFLLLLCNDKAVLGPWVNGKWLNLFTGMVIAVLVMLSTILTAAVLFPTSERAITRHSGRGRGVHRAGGWGAGIFHQGRSSPLLPRWKKERWHMPPLAALPAAMTPLVRLWMVVLRVYLVVAGGLVLYRIALLSLGAH